MHSASMYKNNSLNSWKGIGMAKAVLGMRRKIHVCMSFCPLPFRRYQRHGLVVVAVWAHLAIAADLPLHRSPPPPGLAEVGYLNYHNLSRRFVRPNKMRSPGLGVSFNGYIRALISLVIKQQIKREDTSCINSSHVSKT